MKTNFIRVIQKSKIMKPLICLLLCLTILFNFPISRPASAAPAVLVPVAGAAIGDLLAYLGVTVAAAGGGYALSQAYPYIYDYLKGFGSDVVDWVKGIPDDVYYTDGNTYYVGNSLDNPLESISQLLLKAEYLPESFGLPINFTRIAPRGISYAINGESGGAMWINIDSLLSSSLGNWFTPYLIMTDGTVGVGNVCFKFGLTAGSYPYVRYRESPFIRGEYVTSGMTIAPDRPMYMSCVRQNGEFLLTTKYIISDGLMTSFSNASTGTFSTYQIYGPLYINVDGAAVSSTAVNQIPYGGFLLKSTGYFISKEEPKFKLEVDKDKLKDVYISPYGDPQPPAPNGDDDSETEFELVPPDLWEIFKTVSDFLGNSASKPTNGNTTLGDFVNNNYNYNNVDVDVNVPDRFTIHFYNPLDVNLNLSGGINLDITINDIVSLPEITEGDGENFFSANVIDVFAGLTTNNPIMSVLTALFGVIDPALLAIFSVTISLCLLLALWKLIRGWR